MSSKIALITGASRGLGRNAALAMASKGSDVILTYHSNADAAHDVVKQIEALGQKAIALPLDVANSASFDAFVAQVKAALQSTWHTDRFDHLVNNAGTGTYASFETTTEEQFDQMVNIHLKSTFFLTQKLLPLINDGGRIINLSSGLTRFSMAGFAAYAAMKGAVETLTRYMALELGSRGITVNVVAPGAIETDFGGGMVRDTPEVNAMIAAQTALGRVGVPDDIGGLVASLLSDDNRWVNGQRIEASGGVHL